MSSMSHGTGTGATATPWVSSSIKWHPEVRRALKVAAAEEGVTMPQQLHRLLVGSLQPLGHVQRLTGEEAPR